VGDGVARVRGLSLHHWTDSFERVYGRARLAELQAELGAELGAAMRATFDDDKWYPIEWYRQMCAAARTVSGEGLDAIAKVARASATSEFSGVHRVLLLFVSPQRLLTTAARVFERYYSEGSVEASARGKHSAQVRWSGCLGFDENIWHDTFHATVVVIEMCGGKHTRFEIYAGGRDSDSHATVVFSWT
jgi:hypothetical protein